MRSVVTLGGCRVGGVVGGGSLRVEVRKDCVKYRRVIRKDRITLSSFIYSYCLCLSCPCSFARTHPSGQPEPAGEPDPGFAFLPGAAESPSRGFRGARSTVPGIPDDTAYSATGTVIILPPMWSLRRPGNHVLAVPRSGTPGPNYTTRLLTVESGYLYVVTHSRVPPSTVRDTYR